MADSSGRAPVARVVEVDPDQLRGVAGEHPQAAADDLEPAHAVAHVDRPADRARARVDLEDLVAGIELGLGDGDVHGVLRRGDRVGRARERHGRADPPAGAGVEVDELPLAGRERPQVAAGRREPEEPDADLRARRSVRFPVAGSSVSRRAFRKRPVHTWPPAPRMMFGRPPMRVVVDLAAAAWAPARASARPRTFGLVAVAPHRERGDAAGGQQRGDRGHRERARRPPGAAEAPGAGGASAVPAVRVSISIGAAAPVATIVSRPAARPPAAAAIAARPRSPADWKRCSGALASARAITSSNAAGTPGAASLTAAAAARTGAPTASPRRRRA